MAEPSTSSILIGTGVSSVATYLLGPVLGNYAVIFGMGLMGTLVALTDEDFHVNGEPVKLAAGLWKAFKFIFRGMALSVAFASLGAYFVIELLPKNYELTPFAVLGSVAFTIGWTSNKMSALKDKLVSIVGAIAEKFSGTSDK